MTPFIYLAILIALLLSIATIFIRKQITRNPSAESIKNQKRLLVWWLIFLLCLLVFQLSAIAICVFICGLLYWTVSEVYSLFDKQFSPYHLFILCATVLSLSVLILNYPEQSSFIYALSLLAAALAYFLSIKTSLYIPVLSLYCGLSLVSMVLTIRLAQQASLDYSYLLLLIFFVTSVNDIGQYISGSMFGKSLIAPYLSPNKTVAGLWGGILISSISCTLLLPALISISWIEAFAFGSLIALAGFIGDLLISKLKRGLKVKDSGNSIIGHGGILDRVDSLLLVAPVFGITLRTGEYL